MRKVIVSMNVTLDGYMSGADCELDWHFENWNSEMAECIMEQLSMADTILFGRITYSAMARYRTSVAGILSLQGDDVAFAEMLNGHSKIVFSKTLKKHTWQNTIVVNKPMEFAIQDLKNQEGKNMIVYGSGQVVKALIAFRQVDEFRIWVHPVLLGDGKKLFSQLKKRMTLKLKKTKTFSTGVMLLYYAVIK